MNYYSQREFPQLFHVLPFEEKHMADEILNRIRAKDRELRANLIWELESLMPHTTTKYRKDLVVGRRYGVFGISPFANAWRNGILMQRHGEVYLYVWTFCEDGTFRSDSAWDGYIFDAYPGSGAAKGILVEL